MDLWIRSQDKMKLFRGIDFRGVVEQDGCSIIDNTDDYIIGTYKSIERALEVLDEIQKLLEPQLIIKNSGKIIGSFEDTIIREGATYELKELSTYVYEMPLD